MCMISIVWGVLMAGLAIGVWCACHGWSHPAPNLHEEKHKAEERHRTVVAVELVICTKEI